MKLCFRFLLFLALATHTFAQGQQVYLAVPENPLAKGSLAIASFASQDEQRSLTSWSDEEHREAFHIQQKIGRLWKQQKVDYLFYALINDNTMSKFHIEAIPFSSSNALMKYVDQIKVMENILYRGSTSSVDESTFPFVEDMPAQSTEPSERNCTIFCNKEVIERQLVYEGQYNWVLYNIKQIGLEKRDLLIVPKRHVESFDELSEEEGVEMSQLSGKICSYFQEKGPHKIHVFNKSGERAGQTVKHFHCHLLVERADTPDSVTFWNMVKHMLWSSPLPTNEIRTTAQRLKTDFAKALQE